MIINKFSQKQPKKKKKVFWFFLFLIIGVAGIFFIKSGFTVSQIVNFQDQDQIQANDPDLPKKDPDRFNILFLGIRDINEPGEGQLLADTMIVASIKKSTNQVALISLPRDLYADIYGQDLKHKINFAYPQGGLDCAKKTVSSIIGLYIDYGVVANFDAFVDLVNALGGIDVYLSQPLKEDQQWTGEGWPGKYWILEKDIEGQNKWIFSMPAGLSALDGRSALYFVRSRFTTSDFDRMARQQKALMAIKEKVFSLGILTNPVKVFKLLSIAGKNLRTDMNLSEIKDLLGLVDKLDLQNIKKKIFDTAEQGMLYETFIDQQYVLLPKGDNFDQIKQTCLNIFN